MPLATLSKISIQSIRDFFDYDPYTGAFIKRITNREMLSNTIRFLGEIHEKSRFIWAHYYGVWPPIDLLIDHKDLDHYNNRIENLRLATYSENGCNNMISNPYGYKGVTRSGRRNLPWQAQIRISTTKVNLGRYRSIEEAHAAYQEACVKYHGEFACPK